MWDGRMEHWGGCIRANISNLGEEYKRDKELGEGKWLGTRVRVEREERVKQGALG